MPSNNLLDPTSPQSYGSFGNASQRQNTMSEFSAVRDTTMANGVGIEELKAPVSERSSLHGDGEVLQDWSEEEENRAVRKIDTLVMPLLILGFLALQFDRGNMQVLGNSSVEQ